MNLPKQRVDAVLPLTLWKTVRTHDTPAELLPDEKLEMFFPTRLGLSGVVEEQIRHFDRLARRRRRVDSSEVAALLELIARRPDAEAIFESAGRELARQRFNGPLGRARALTKRLPHTFRKWATARGLRAAHGNVLIAESLVVGSSPMEMRATDTLTAQANAAGKACLLYSALASTLAELNGAGPMQAIHSRCQARGDDSCVWELKSDEARVGEEED